MADSEWKQRGVNMRSALFGEAAEAKIDATAYGSLGMQKFREYGHEAVFGGLWSRDGLDLKTRTLICVVSDTVMGREDELAIHLRFALRQGWSENELTEAILHLAGYIGLPLVRGAMLKAGDVFEEIRAEGGA